MSRWWWLIAGALVVAGVVWLAIQVAVLGQTARDDASTYGAFALALLVAGIPLARAAARRATVTPATRDLDQLTDDLAVVVLAQWDQAARERGLLPLPLPIRWQQATQSVAGRVSHATRPGPAALDPLPGVDRVTPRQLRQGTHRMLHTIYGGLASGRLILLGGPGAGKTSAAILLLRDALRYRWQHDPADRTRIPVPVLLTLHGWDPDTTPVRDWLAATLATQIPLLAQRRHRGQTAMLLSSGRIAVFLDGLDEISEPLRISVLKALSEQATFRLVLLTRTAELVTAAQRHILTGAVALELQALTVADAQDYLRQSLAEPPASPWQRLLSHLSADADSPLARALATPLTITLLRMIYPPATTPSSPVGEVDELLDTTRFAHPDDITHHLLDQAIAVAYTPRPGHAELPYTPVTAHHTLSLIARHLRDSNTRDLTWWAIPNWLRGAPRALIELPTVLVPGLMIGLAYGLPFGLAFGPVAGLTVGLSFAMFAVLLVFAIDRAPDSGRPRTVRRVTLRRLMPRQYLGFALVFGLSLGLVLGMAVKPDVGLAAGLTISLVAWVTYGLATEAFGDAADVSGPQQIQRSNIAGGLAFGLVFALDPAVTLGIMFTATGKLTAMSLFVPAGVVSGLVLGLACSAAWRLWLCQIYLHVRYHTPLSLIRFLEDARARHLLRTVGPIYQFRHATLQDRLAPPTTAGKRT